MKIVVIGGTGLIGSKVVVKLRAPSFEPDAVLSFFQTSTRDLLAAEAEAGA